MTDCFTPGERSQYTQDRNLDGLQSFRLVAKRKFPTSSRNQTVVFCLQPLTSLTAIMAPSCLLLMLYSSVHLTAKLILYQLSNYYLRYGKTSSKFSLLTVSMLHMRHLPQKVSHFCLQFILLFEKIYEEMWSIFTVQLKLTIHGFLKKEIIHCQVNMPILMEEGLFK